MKFTDILSEFCNKYSGVIYVVIGAIFVILSYKMYFHFIDNQKKKPDVANANRQLVTINVYFFSLDWCPHCTTAAPIWRNFVNKYDKEIINGYQINCIGGKTGSNCGDQYDPDVAELIAQFNLTSYPCIKFLKDETVVDFAAKITEDNLKNCLNNLIN
jgi:thiol-disulfide isomerase/thioredoxin